MQNDFFQLIDREYNSLWKLYLSFLRRGLLIFFRFFQGRGLGQRRITIYDTKFFFTKFYFQLAYISFCDITHFEADRPSVFSPFSKGRKHGLVSNNIKFK